MEDNGLLSRVDEASGSRRPPGRIIRYGSAATEYAIRPDFLKIATEFCEKALQLAAEMCVRWNALHTSLIDDAWRFG